MIEALLERIEIRPAAYAYRSRFGRTPPAMPQRPSLTKRNIDADREEFAACRLSILAWPAVVISSPTEAFDQDPDTSTSREISGEHRSVDLT